MFLRVKEKSISLLLICVIAFIGILANPVDVSASQPEKIKVKVFVGAMFEIGANAGDRAGEFQHWYERYFMNTEPVTIAGTENPFYCNFVKERQ